MASCLGLYIDVNLIKYAKVSKERETVKVEAFGVKFYTDFESTIKQIIEETYSYKIPISVNLSEEMYEYFNMFSLLNKNDLEKAIKTEFESFCAEKGYNNSVFETRYAISDNVQDKQKLKVIHVSANKIDLNKIDQQLGGYNIAGVFPLPMSIPNLIKFEPKENSIVVNIENKTTVTTIIDQKVYDVEKIDYGMEEILTKINSKENSYSKSYEVCKETTIYTSEGKELSEEQTGYLEDIMPVLYQIVGQVQKILNGSFEKINNVYITGAAALINNIDLYFEEYLEGVNCEIVKPNFINITPEINIKDYIEVNSAISLALMGLGQGIAGMNFKKSRAFSQFKNLLNAGGNNGRQGSDKRFATNLFTNDLKQPLDKIEIGLLRGVSTLVILLVVYSTFSILLNQQIKNKENEAQEFISRTNSQIALAEKDNEKIKTRTNEYTTMIKNLEEINEKISDRNKTKKAIPSLLNQLMYIIPEEVQITSIQNTSDTHIEIIARSAKYEQLGFFTAKIKTEPVLTNVISSAGQKENDMVTIKIEGDLP